jgi:hypothetical protein
MKKQAVYNFSILLCMCVLLVLSSQNTHAQRIMRMSPLVNGTEDFNSIFSKLTSGKFQGTVTGKLMLTVQEEDTTIAPQETEALLEIIPDEADVYDIAFANYSFKKGNTDYSIKYSEYCLANGIEIYIWGYTYELSGIDGSCDLVLPGLVYTYDVNGNTEKMTLNFTQDIILEDTTREQILTIRKGSVLVWTFSK